MVRLVLAGFELNALVESKTCYDAGDPEDSMHCNERRWMGRPVQFEISVSQRKKVVNSTHTTMDFVWQ